MSRALNKLTTRQVAGIKETGRHSDGGGLYFRVTTHGARSWVFMTNYNGRRIEIGLGAVTAISLAKARELAGAMRSAVALGDDPRTVLAVTAEQVYVPTFGEVAEDYIKGKEAGWRNAVHRQQWRNSLRDHAAAIRDVPVDQIDTDRVLDVLRPIWTTKSETAKRVRSRIENILDAARVRGLRPTGTDNPAKWRGHLDKLLPKPSRLTRGHHAALRQDDMPAFMEALQRRQAEAARCLEFVILTVARSGEALGATWAEIDLKAALWTVPASRMKAGKEHVVPLSTAALALLQARHSTKARPADKLFGVEGAARSNMAMAMLLRRMGYGHVTVHGFRSTFRDWVGESTDYAGDLAEFALAHAIGNKTEAAYRRGKAIERRRAMMEDWARYIISDASGQEVAWSLNNPVIQLPAADQKY